MILHILVLNLFQTGTFGALLKNRSQDALSLHAPLQQDMPALHQSMLRMMNDDGEDDPINMISNTFDFMNDDSPEDKGQDDQSDDSDEEQEHIAPPPLDPLYQGGDVAAGWVEKHNGIKMVTEGSQ